MITCLIFSSVLFSLHLQNLTEVEEIEWLLLENDVDMIPRDEIVVFSEFDEETWISCRKCGHLFYSAEALGNHDNISHANDKRFPLQNCNKDFCKDRHKGHCLGQYDFRNYCILFKEVGVKSVASSNPIKDKIWKIMF